MIRRMLVAALGLGLAASGAVPCRAAPGTADTLAFEVPAPPGKIPGFGGGPAGTLCLDSTDVHAGRGAARIVRDSTSTGDFSALTRCIPVTFSGSRLTLRGWLRTRDVTQWAGLWVREDGAGGSVQFDNMEKRGPRGTTPWTQYTVELPLDPKARGICFGALLAGRGEAGVDDLDLLVDGKPAGEAPSRPRDTTAVDTDHEFDGGSRVEIDRLSAIQIESLVLLGKVWGFVKYHHPRVTSAAVRWDYELFRALPAVLAARDRPAAAAALATWLERTGEPAPCSPCATLPESTAMRPRLAWIRDRARLGERLSAALVRIYERRPAKVEQHYAGQVPGVRNPVFANEAPFASRFLPDAGYRLLALYRFWNIVEYWAPGRDLIREDWDGVLRDFVPRVALARTVDDYRLAMVALVAAVHDGHANLWSDIAVRPPRGECRLPVTLRVVEDRFVVGAWTDSIRGPASGLRIGDVILAVDGAPVDSLARAWAPFYGASNDVARGRDIALALAKGPGGPCRLRVLRAEGPLELTVQRDSLEVGAAWQHDLPGPTFRLLDPDVAYLKLSSVVADSVPSYLRQASGTRLLVVDIRNYPSEFVVFALGQHLVDQPTPFVCFTVGDPANPGAFVWRDPNRLEPAAPRYGGRVVILVDEITQSSAEYTALALRASPGALVVGSTTAGADGNVSGIPLPGGLRALISGIGVFYPDRRPTQQVGIVPDFVVRPTIAGVREGRDEVLEAAIERALGRRIAVPRD